jgi:hypothetical protein
MSRSTFLGATFLIAGVLLYGFVHLAIANYVPSMGGWSTFSLSESPGKFSQARDAVMVNIPYFLSILLFVIGLVLLFYKEIKSVFDFFKGDD